MSPDPGLLTSLLAAALFLGCTVSAPPQVAGGPLRGPGPGFELSPGAVVDAGSTLAVVARPGGGIEAIDLRSGRVLWASQAASWPLAVVAGRVLALAEPAGSPRLRFVVIDDPESGGDPRSFRLALQEDALPTLDERLDGAFTVAARKQDGELYVDWSVEQRAVSGAAPAGGGTAPTTLRGSARIDLEAGRALAVAAEGPPTLLETLPPALADVLADRSGASVWRNGDLVASAELADLKSGSPRVELRRWRLSDGSELPRTTLLDSRPVMWLASADRRHLAVVRRAAISAREEYVWAIHSLSSGALAGELRHHRSATAFVIANGLVIHVSPPHGRLENGAWVERGLQLRAVDLAGGVERWSRALRDTTYRGPMPPGSQNR